MAKKRNPPTGGKKKQGSPSSSSVSTSSFSKGMNKDVAPSLENNQSWWHARNAANNSEDGDLGVIGNEPSNLQCGVIPYTIIGAVHRYGDEWIIYTTDNINSEIGRFDDSECKYTPIVNDPCLAFNKKYLITGAAKENFDCTWEVYWDDGNNPSRSLNIDDVPYIQELVIGSAPCDEYVDKFPLVLDCEKIRLAPLVDTPCLELTKSIDGGMLPNGSYQAFIAYTENEQKVTDYIGVSNIQTLWSKLGSGGSLNLAISNLDKDFDNYQLVILSRNQGQTVAKILGLYSTEQQDIEIDFIDPALVSPDLKTIPLRSPAYEKSESMFVVNDWLIRQGPTEQFDFNYQPIANEIQVNWVVNEVPDTYYSLGGNKMGFMRDEQYAFFIRWIYNTGERSSSYHIPGRAPENYVTPAGTTIGVEDSEITNTNAIDGPNFVFQIYNTASSGVPVSEAQPDGTTIIQRGQMAYWQSSEKYPTNKPDIWGDLCGEPIRHHKMPTEELANNLHLSNGTSLTPADKLHILGVEFANIGRPKNNDGSYITNVVGYEILRGSRLGARSILAKGLFRNMRQYQVPNAENLIGSAQGLYPNYPYNDLRPDLYFHDGSQNAGALKRTNSCDSFAGSIQAFPPIGSPASTITPDLEGGRGYSRKVFTFSSPELMFNKPFLNAYETRLYGQYEGNQRGYFIPSEDHPRFKILKNAGAVLAAIVGLGYAFREIKGNVVRGREGPKGNYYANDFFGVIPGPIASSGPVGVTGVGPNFASNFGGASLAATESTVTSLAMDVFYESVGGILDIYTGGFASYTMEAAQELANSLVALAPGVIGGSYNQTTEKDTSLSSLPILIKLIIGYQSAKASIVIGGNEVIDAFYAMVNESAFVYKYNSEGIYNNYNNQTNGSWRIKNNDSNYLGSSFQTFGNGKYKINNLFRPTTVAIELSKEIDDPDVDDKSRFVMGGEVNASGSATTFGDSTLLNPGNSRKREISAYYGALKFNFDNQYGQLDGIKQIQMRGCVQLLDPAASLSIMYTSDPIFAGDTFVGRYTEKTIMPIFTDYLMGQPDGFTFNYSMYVNVPYPRYWLNSQRYDMGPLAEQVTSFGLYGTSDWDAIYPDDLFYLDRGNNSCNSGLSGMFGNANDPNPPFAMEFAYSYTHNNGVLDFYVETEINLTQRESGDEPKNRIYDIYGYNDIDALFHAALEKEDNYYKYDESLSPSKFPTQLVSFGNVQPRDYDPYVSETCFVSYPKRLIYSLQAQKESKKDYWRVFLNLNYKDFKNAVSVIKPINKSGALVFFPYLSPQMFQGLDTLKTQLDTKLTIGDGGLFSQPFQNVANAEISTEYGSCESLRGVINTPSGIFFISQAQGKIFQYGGKGLDPISNNGMKWWFAKYLPSSLIRQFPLLESSVLSDNPIAGVGCQVMYDSVDDIVYFMKKDYKVKDTFLAATSLNSTTYTESGGFQVTIEDKNGLITKVNVTIGDPLYFEDCSWTVSYDPKSKAWISFHDWHPELAIPSINHFFTTKTSTTEIPQCPPGYTFNSGNGMCEIGNSTNQISTPASYDVCSFYRHNVRCDSFVNYYGIDYPWEIDMITNTGQSVNTVRSFEYQLETYVYKGEALYNMCGGDKWEDLNYNFDSAIVYNNDQTSGLLILNQQPVNDPWGNLTYPIIGPNNINILASKVEHKFRFNQFWDITNDRGEFTNAEQATFVTSCNGYVRPLNSVNLNYNKLATQRKKFRHYSNQVILRRNVSGNRKMLLRLNNTKLELSMR
jgi:hypothetical protein